MNYVLALMVAALVGIYFVLRKKNARSNTRPDERQKRVSAADSAFHAVSLKYSAGACQSATDMKGRRFLSSAAPRIPLPGCDATECRCKFVHHDDRRTAEDRRSPIGHDIGGQIIGGAPPEKRESGERRDDSPDDIF